MVEIRIIPERWRATSGRAKKLSIFTIRHLARR
jgi:hypothetical protein